MRDDTTVPELPPGVEGPPVPANGTPVDVEMDECPSCGADDVPGQAWLVRFGRGKGTVCVQCFVCYETGLGQDEGGRQRELRTAHVAGATHMILRAIERSTAEVLYEKFIRVSVAIAKDEIRADCGMSLGAVPPTVSSFAELHDHRDANEYGGLCRQEYLDAWGIPEDLLLRAANEIQGQIDAWIKIGGLR